MPIEDTPENRKKAEMFADQFEAAIGEMGSTPRYFCPEQRQRWRQHAISAFMGTAPDYMKDVADPSAPLPGFPPSL